VSVRKNIDMQFTSTMKSTKIVHYEERLIRKERGIKIANGVVFIMYIIYFISVLLFDVDDRITTSDICPSVILILLVRINEIHLKHIESIKLRKSALTH
jgi:hypothetical protein